MKKIKIKKQKKEKSKKWLTRHFNDLYYQEARRKGFRSRSAFKLIQINEKYKIFFKNAKILDLGSAPGGWSQVAKKLCGFSSTVIGIDRLEIMPLDGVNFVRGDLNDLSIRNKISEFFPSGADIILSDMAPNTTGHHETDHIRITGLVELALEISNLYLNRNGFFICKIFQGGAQGELLESVKYTIKNVKYFKPDASRKESSETYLIGKKK